MHHGWSDALQLKHSKFAHHPVRPSTEESKINNTPTMNPLASSDCGGRHACVRGYVQTSEACLLPIISLITPTHSQANWFRALSMNFLPGRRLEFGLLFLLKKIDSGNRAWRIENVEADTHDPASPRPGDWIAWSVSPLSLRVLTHGKFPLWLRFHPSGASKIDIRGCEWSDGLTVTTFSQICGADTTLIFFPWVGKILQFPSKRRGRAAGQAWTNTVRPLFHSLTQSINPSTSQARSLPPPLSLSLSPERRLPQHPRLARDLPVVGRRRVDGGRLTLVDGPLSPAEGLPLAPSQGAGAADARAGLPCARHNLVPFYLPYQFNIRMSFSRYYHNHCNVTLRVGASKFSPVGNTLHCLLPNEPCNPCSLLRSVESALAATKKQKTARTVAKAIRLEEEEGKRRERGNIAAGQVKYFWYDPHAPTVILRIL